MFDVRVMNDMFILLLKEHVLAFIQAFRLA